MSERGTPQELAEFAVLSTKIADRQATDAERSRWRDLRIKLAPPPPATPPARAGLTASVVAKLPQRQHPRATKKLRFAYTAEKAMPIGFSDEVSAGGLRMTLHHHVEVGAMFVFRLQLAGPTDTEPLNVTGRVAWVKRDGNHFAVGIEFLGLSGADKERLDAYSLAPRDDA